MIQRPDENSEDIFVVRDKDPTNNPIVQASATWWWPWAGLPSPWCCLALWCLLEIWNQSSPFCCVSLALFMLGPHCGAGSSVVAVSSLAVERGCRTRGLSSCGSRLQSAGSVVGAHGLSCFSSQTGVETASLEGGLFTSAPPGKSHILFKF